MQLNSQSGIGLVEVMVALLLLAIAVLGFSAMQMTAIKATDESLMRGNALAIMRGGAEMMRANPDGITNFADALNGNVDSVSVNSKSITADSCLNVTVDSDKCSLQQLATRDGLMVKRYAKDSDIKIRVVDCPGTGGSSGQPLRCFIAGWGNTNATVGTGDADCLDSTGIYNKGSSCFVLEAY